MVLCGNSYDVTLCLRCEDVAALYSDAALQDVMVAAAHSPKAAVVMSMQLAEQHGYRGEAKAYDALQKDAAAMAEIKSYQEAVRARLGSRAYQSMACGAQVRVPGADSRQLAEVSRTVQTVRQAQTTARQVQQLARGQKPKLRR